MVEENDTEEGGLEQRLADLEEKIDSIATTRNTHQLEPLYKPAEIAEHWGLSEYTVMELIRLGEIRSVRVGRKRLRIPHSAVEQYLEGQSQGGLNNEGVLEIEDIEEREEHVI